ncbi:MAG: helix-turn-helix domain-containing protein [Proteobacteria bacterium]|nr:helix-turn-helix domain-containing protein [Pseudomonadota bacterium]
MSQIKSSPIHLHQALAEVAWPFLSKIGCHYFQYLKVFKDGSFSFLTTQPTWEQYCIDLFHKTNKPAVYSHIDAHTLDKNTYTFLWEPNLPEEPVRLAREFNIAHGFTFVERHSDYYYMMGFAAPVTHHRAMDAYFNSLNDMHTFIQEFKHNQRKLINELDNNRICVPKSRQDCNLEKMLLTSNKHHLTPQERASIQGLAQGKSYKEIAITLGISHRTVETYLNRVRHRFNLHHKKELISLL